MELHLLARISLHSNMLVLGPSIRVRAREKDRESDAESVSRTILNANGIDYNWMMHSTEKGSILLMRS